MTAPLNLARGDARALRFLILCLIGWTGLRIMIVWNPAMPAEPPGMAAPWAPPPPMALSAPRVAVPASIRAVRSARRFRSPPAIASGVATASRDRRAPPPVVVLAATGADRHSLRLALMARLLPGLADGAARGALPGRTSFWSPSPLAAHGAAGQGEPFWMHRQRAGWSLSGWLYLRQGSAAAPDAVAAPGQLGGSQAGARLSYGPGDGGGVRGYSRATIAIDRPRQRELAFGLSYAPASRWPIDVAIEQRVAVGREGRTAIAAMVSGGAGDIALPGGFRLEAYGQAGVVGARRRDGFADGAVVVDHRIGRDAQGPLRLGALAAGAAQPGAARVDVGPRLSLRLPDVGEGGRIALDWRQRVAGDAPPESGLAVTLGADF